MMNVRACVLLNKKKRQHFLSGGLICSDKSGPFPPFVTIAVCCWVSKVENVLKPDSRIVIRETT